MRSTITALGSALALAIAAPLAAAPPSLPQYLSYRFVSQLAAPEHGDRIAWIEDIRGVRNVWVASGPGYAPRQLTHYTEDDGQELTQLAFDPTGDHLVYVRGGDHDGNWPAEGDQPAVSPQGRVAYVKDDQLWATSLDGAAKPAKLLFDRGKDREPVWSPDGSRLAFVSGRGDHNFITVFTPGHADLTYIAPSTSRDDDPVWSPDGRRIAFTRQPGDGGAPEPLLVTTPKPFAIWTADATTGEATLAWR
jgi:dipeptidyl aminopeptidase/acylaminoacyl peptidase